MRGNFIATFIENDLNDCEDYSKDDEHVLDNFFSFNNICYLGICFLILNEM